MALAGSVFLIAQNLVPCDDAYITFRHVKNLLHASRPSWNLEGRPVLGSSSPGFIFVLAGFCRLLGISEPDRCVLCFNAICHFAIVTFTYLVGFDLLQRSLPSILLALLVAVNGVALYTFSQGFESAFFLAILMASLFFVSRGRDYVALLFGAFAPLARPEGVLAAILVWSYVLYKRRFSVKRLCVFAVIPSVWIVWASYYYGLLVPHSIVAKTQFPSVYNPYHGHSVNLLERLPAMFPSAIALWRETASFLLADGCAAPEFETIIQIIRRWFILIGIPLAIVAFARNRRGVIYGLYPLLFLLLFGLIGYTQPWYFPSFVIVSLIVLFVGWVRALDLVRDWRSKAGGTDRETAWASRVLILMVFAAFLTANDYRINRGQFDYSHRAVVFPVHPWGALWDLREVQRFEHYRTAAEYLNAHSSPSARVLASEVGVLGYYYHGEMIDAVGLCSPEALAFYPPPSWDIRDAEGRNYTTANNLVPTAMVLTLRPEYVVNSQCYVFNLLRNGAGFLAQYEEVLRFGRVWGEPIVIFRRRDLETAASSDRP